MCRLEARFTCFRVVLVLVKCLTCASFWCVPGSDEGSGAIHCGSDAASIGEVQMLRLRLYKESYLFFVVEQLPTVF